MICVPDDYDQNARARLITRQSELEKFVDYQIGWHLQNLGPKTISGGTGISSESTVERLRALKRAGVTQSGLAEIFKNERADYGAPSCDECGNVSEELVRFGGEPIEYEYDPTDLCRECLAKALALFSR